VQFEPIMYPKLVVDTDRPLEECVAEAGKYLELLAKRHR
jgi:hypothetical protein